MTQEQLQTSLVAELETLSQELSQELSSNETGGIASDAHLDQTSKVSRLAQPETIDRSNTQGALRSLQSLLADLR